MQGSKAIEARARIYRLWEQRFGSLPDAILEGHGVVFNTGIGLEYR